MDAAQQAAAAHWDRVHAREVQRALRASAREAGASAQFENEEVARQLSLQGVEGDAERQLEVAKWESLESALEYFSVKQARKLAGEVEPSVVTSVAGGQKGQWGNKGGSSGGRGDRPSRRGSRLANMFWRAMGRADDDGQDGGPRAENSDASGARSSTRRNMRARSQHTAGLVGFHRPDGDLLNHTEENENENDETATRAGTHRSRQPRNDENPRYDDQSSINTAPSATLFPRRSRRASSQRTAGLDPGYQSQRGSLHHVDEEGGDEHAPGYAEFRATTLPASLQDYPEEGQHNGTFDAPPAANEGHPGYGEEDMYAQSEVGTIQPHHSVSSVGTGAQPQYPQYTQVPRQATQPRSTRSSRAPQSQPYKTQPPLSPQSQQPPAREPQQHFPHATGMNWQFPTQPPLRSPSPPASLHRVLSQHHDEESQRRNRFSQHPLRPPSGRARGYAGSGVGGSAEETFQWESVVGYGDGGGEYRGEGDDAATMIGPDPSTYPMSDGFTVPGPASADSLWTWTLLGVYEVEGWEALI
ncbi:hypothetical protein LTR62_002759 [Meristemomyces frigidus]|uniref:Uncharacterized protein n=1 Tax=Meristemomyces frigidus TaxID=1508187 RepID=A0AAN7TFJ2_9PEZI|nr:hypothetical protein LTR62_002759 [Meristemomyces frigidus]